MTHMVKVGIIPGKIVEVALAEDGTVADALALAEIDTTDGYRISVDGEEADLDTEIDDDSSVLLTRKIKGN